MILCEYCGGPTVFLGNLGETLHYRCRDCGAPMSEPDDEYVPCPGTVARWPAGDDGFYAARKWAAENVLGFPGYRIEDRGDHWAIRLDPASAVPVYAVHQDPPAPRHARDCRCSSCRDRRHT